MDLLDRWGNPFPGRFVLLENTQDVQISLPEHGFSFGFLYPRNLLISRSMTRPDSGAAQLDGLNLFRRGGPGFFPSEPLLPPLFVPR